MVMLPSESSSCRGEQKAALAGVIYDKKTDAALGALLSTLSEEKGGEGLNEVQKAVIRDAAKSYKRETCLPRELATRIAELETEGYNAWIEARSKADFSIFAPVLQEWLDISLKKAELVDPEAPAYDVLLDSFEKGMTGARLDEIFAEVRAGLVPLLSEVRSKGTPPDTSLLKGKFNPAQQAMLCESIALDLGFDLSRGRLDVSVHPFTGGTHPTDVRMTTRFKEEDITEGLTGAIHETGHSLYEQVRLRSCLFCVSLSFLFLSFPFGLFLF
jgi:carboxypeptidase Taq